MSQTNPAVRRRKRGIVIVGRKRSKNIDDSTAEQIVQILDGWHDPKLTWDLLSEQIMLRTYSQYTRQALYNSVRIRMAYKLAKERIGGEKPSQKRRMSKELQLAIARIGTLKAENTRLVRENNQLLEQFCRWAYNANTRSISEDFLNQPLPKVFRGQTPSEPVPSLTYKRGRRNK